MPYHVIVKSTFHNIYIVLICVLCDSFSMVYPIVIFPPYYVIALSFNFRV